MKTTKKSTNQFEEKKNKNQKNQNVRSIFEVHT